MTRIIDVSSWKEKTSVNTTGARKKYWLKNPSNEKMYLFKIPKIDGEIYAEILAADLAINVYGLNAPKVHLAKKDDIHGVLTKSFVNIDNNEEFSEILDYFGPDFDADNLSEYTIEKAYEVAEAQSILYEFYEMCFFDSIIGNQDRHCENWGILYDSEHKGDLAPLYDNGSSLLNGESEDKIKKMLSNQDMIRGYVNRAKTCFTVNGKKKAKVKDLLSALYNMNPIIYDKVLPVFYPFDNEAVHDRITQVSGIIISDDRQKVLKKIIEQKTLVLSEYNK